MAEFIYHIVGQDSKDMENSEGEIAIVAYKNTEPFDEIQRFQTPIDEYEFSTLAIDRQSNRESDFSVAVLYGGRRCKLIKLPHEV